MSEYRSLRVRMKYLPHYHTWKEDITVLKSRCWYSRRKSRRGRSRSLKGKGTPFSVPHPYFRFGTYIEIMTEPIIVKREIGNRTFHFVVGRTYEDMVHLCTIDDIAKILHHIPERDTDSLPLIVLRQPTRKQKLMEPAWGRYRYFSTLPHIYGLAIVLEAQNKSPHEKHWSTTLTPFDERELQRMADSGYKIRRARRSWVVNHSPALDRSTQLYRTLLHEIGHHVDYLESVQRPAKGSRERHLELEEKYSQKTKHDMEDFAHRYADKTRCRLFQAGVLPFERIYDEKSLLADELRLEDFALPPAEFSL